MNTEGGNVYINSPHAEGPESAAGGRDAAAGQSVISSGRAQVAQADHASAAAAGGATAVTVVPSLKDRAAGAPWWSKLSGALAIVAVIAATLLLALNKTDIGVAGYIVAVVAVVIGAIPVIRG